MAVVELKLTQLTISNINPAIAELVTSTELNWANTVMNTKKVTLATVRAPDHPYSAMQRCDLRAGRCVAVVPRPCSSPPPSYEAQFACDFKLRTLD